MQKERLITETELVLKGWCRWYAYLICLFVYFTMQRRYARADELRMHVLESAKRHLKYCQWPGISVGYNVAVSCLHCSSNVHWKPFRSSMSLSLYFSHSDFVLFCFLGPLSVSLSLLLQLKYYIISNDLFLTEKWSFEKKKKTLSTPTGFFL